MGSEHNGIFVGSDWFIDSVVDNTKVMAKFLSENNISYDLPES